MKNKIFAKFFVFFSYFSFCSKCHLVYFHDYKLPKSFVCIIHQWIIEGRHLLLKLSKSLI